MRVKFGLKIPNRLGKTKKLGGFFRSLYEQGILYIDRPFGLLSRKVSHKILK